jgi:hypothetical protein
LRKGVLREDGENSISCTSQPIQQYYGDEMKEDEVGEKYSRLTRERYEKYVQNFSLKAPRKETTCRPAGIGGLMLSIF